jgi:hypothetical protein
MYPEIFDIARAIHQERTRTLQRTLSLREAVAGSQPQSNLYRWFAPIREYLAVRTRELAVRTRGLTVRTRGQWLHRYVAFGRVHRPEIIRDRSTS